MKKVLFTAMAIFGEAAFSPLLANMPLIDEIAAQDKAADDAVAAISTSEELKAKQAAWRAWWLDALGGMPKRTPLNARVVGTVQCEGFRLENIIFESEPGMYVTAHLAMPEVRTRGNASPPPVVLMPLGHSDTGILNPRYAAHLAMTARAGFAAFAWDPISQGERRQACDKKYDYTDNCSTEHARLGARSWLVGWNFARFRIWDAVRAIDYVESRTDLDCSKLGIMGTSGGGTMSAYMQAFDPRIKVAFPSCYISSLREVIGARGCHDAEQFFWNMLPNGFNHAALLAMGQPRVALATGSRWKDYFPHAGAVATFAVFTNMTARLGFAGPYWHFSCDGPHGLPPSTRAAQVDWMRHCILGTSAPKPLADYHILDRAGTDAKDPCHAAIPFSAEATFCTPTHQVRDLPGFKSVYAIIADEARRLAKERRPHAREELREIVRRRAGMRPLAELGGADEVAFKHRFGWWYLDGREGKLAENQAAILATLGRSRVGVKAEAILRDAAKRVAANGGKSVPLEAKGAGCIAAAHAYAAEPQLFSSVMFNDPPPSWTEMVTNPDPRHDSYAVAVWGALKDYDWTDLVP
ncbi:MAG: acetylxylan esterase [Kiritimatiellae bacterium]|nr:acetylxylan esterase [Kiritimatiellia bacterium]